MANTEFGVNHPLAVKLWSKKLIAEALKKTYVKDFMGTGSNSLIHKKDETSKSAGDKVTFGLRMQLTGDGAQGDATLEGNEEALSIYNDSVLINQLRHAVRSQGKMSEQRVPFDVRQEAMEGLSDWLAGRIDTWFFNQIGGASAVTDTRYTGNNAAVAPSATRLVAANNHTTEGSISATDSAAFSLKLIDRAVALAKTATPFIRPIKAGGREFYVGFLHPFQVYQLRASVGSTQWSDIEKSKIQGGDLKDNPIFTGALGMYNNVVLHESTRLPDTAAGAAGGKRAVLCGAQAAVYAYGKDQSSGSGGTWNEELFDYGNQLGVGGGLIGGLKKTVFNNVDFATVVMSSYSPDPNA